jgi:putative ABC transport system permease protein
MNELRELAAELWAVRRRLLPVVLGLCLGTLGLSVLLAFGDGFDQAMRAALARSGESMLRWSGGSTARAFAGQPAGRTVPLSVREVDALASAPGVVAVSPEAQLGGRVLGEDGRGVNVNIVAVGHDWLRVRGMSVAPLGRFLSAPDTAERRRVAVVGARTARELFGRDDVVGRTVRVFDTPFTIVGVLPTVAALMQYGGDDDRKVVVPFTTAQAMRGFRYVTHGLVRIDSADRGRQREAEQRARLAELLRFDPADRAAVRLSNHAVQSQEIRGIVAGTRVFLIIIGVLGLLVAAVGVANMTFVLVEERVREIGLRMALGAAPRQIRNRQLAETACVVAIGGSVGLLLAALLLVGVNQLPLDPAAKGYLGDPILSASSALAVAAILGLCAGIAGWHPAARAAAVEPVEALRHD